MTNFEKIKAMSKVEEMANWAAIHFKCNQCVMFNRCRNEEFKCLVDCNKGIKQWLESEADEMIS